MAKIPSNHPSVYSLRSHQETSFCDLVQKIVKFTGYFFGTTLMVGGAVFHSPITVIFGIGVICVSYALFSQKVSSNIPPSNRSYQPRNNPPPPTYYDDYDHADQYVTVPPPAKQPPRGGISSSSRFTSPGAANSAGAGRYSTKSPSVGGPSVVSTKNNSKLHSSNSRYSPNSPSVGGPSVVSQHSPYQHAEDRPHSHQSHSSNNHNNGAATTGYGADSPSVGGPSLVSAKNDSKVNASNNGYSAAMPSVRKPSVVSQHSEYQPPPVDYEEEDWSYSYSSHSSNNHNNGAASTGYGAHSPGVGGPSLDSEEDQYEPSAGGYGLHSPSVGGASILDQ